jgi:hypothetical protein
MSALTKRCEDGVQVGSWGGHGVCSGRRSDVSGRNCPLGADEERRDKSCTAVDVVMARLAVSCGRLCSRAGRKSKIVPGARACFERANAWHFTRRGTHAQTSRGK